MPKKMKNNCNNCKSMQSKKMEIANEFGIKQNANSCKGNSYRSHNENIKKTTDNCRNSRNSSNSR